MLNDIKNYSICGPIRGICKRPAIWGHMTVDGMPNGMVPLVYFQKPKWLDEETFHEIVKTVTVNLPRGLGIEE
jgi:hypothetical protein